MFVYLEGSWHPMGENETTVCGIVVPHGTPWVREATEVHYGDLPGQDVPKAPAKPSVIKAKKKG